VSDQVKRVGRPRQWASEADRKRAYRARKATELAEPLVQRQAAQAARREVAGQQAVADEARQEAQRWQRRAAAAEKRAGTAERRAVRESAAAKRFLAERDEARRLLRRKLQWAQHAKDAHFDAHELLALVAELYAELAKLRKELAALKAKGSTSDRSLPYNYRTE
jgi:replicative superfamily II helicase